MLFWPTHSLSAIDVSSLKESGCLIRANLKRHGTGLKLNITVGAVNYVRQNAIIPPSASRNGIPLHNRSPKRYQRERGTVAKGFRPDGGNRVGDGH